MYSVYIMVLEMWNSIKFLENSLPWGPLEKLSLSEVDHSDKEEVYQRGSGALLQVA